MTQLVICSVRYPTHATSVHFPATFRYSLPPVIGHGSSDLASHNGMRIANIEFELPVGSCVIPHTYLVPVHIYVLEVFRCPSRGELFPARMPWWMWCCLTPDAML